MEVFGKLISISDNKVTVELEKGTNIRLLEVYGQGLVKLEIDDGRKRTLEQLRKAHALFNDISKSRGMTVPDVKDLMRAYYYERYREEMPSERVATVTQQKDFIEVTLDFCFEEGIPFETRTWDSIQSDYGTQLRCLKHRECVICRKHADYCHVEAVGSGNNRKKIDHSKHHFMSLCRIHHNDQHDDGIDSFINKWHIKPISLTGEQCVELGIETYKTYSYYKEREEELIRRGDVIK